MLSLKDSGKKSSCLLPASGGCQQALEILAAVTVQSLPLISHGLFLCVYVFSSWIWIGRNNTMYFQIQVKRSDTTSTWSSWNLATMLWRSRGYTKRPHVGVPADGLRWGLSQRSASASRSVSEKAFKMTPVPAAIWLQPYERTAQQSPVNPQTRER